MVVGTTLGGGILYTPGLIAAFLPNKLWYMFVWGLGAINALLGATVFAELGAMIPLSGGLYSFARRGLGDYAGFVVGFTQWALYCASNAALLLIGGEYLSMLFPELASFRTAIALSTLLIIAALNWHSVREGGRIQIVTTLAKTVAFSAIIVAAFVLPKTHSTAAGFALQVPQGISLLVALVLAMQGVIFTYDSYYCSVFFSEEVRNPGREIPRAIFRGLAVIIVLYLSLNAAFLYVLPMEKIAAEPFVGGVVAAALFGEQGALIIRIVVLISIVGTVNAVILMTARVLLAMGRDGLFARQATRVNAGGTPTVALCLSTVVTAIFIVSGTAVRVLAVTALLMAVNYLLSYWSLVALRRREPQALRPYRAWGYPWTTAAAILFGVAFILGVALNEPRNGSIALGVLILSFPAYLCTRRLLQAGTAPIKSSTVR